jgi:hypothetical protein
MHAVILLLHHLILCETVCLHSLKPYPPAWRAQLLLDAVHGSSSELELELLVVQTHMTQKPVLWVEVGAHAVRKRSECAGVVWAGAGVAWGLCV